MKRTTGVEETALERAARDSVDIQRWAREGVAEVREDAARKAGVN
jgi:hypothetical protein